MGSIAEEMKKVIQQWDAEDQQPQQEIKMETKKRGSITSVILGYIKDKPGVTSIEIKQRLSVEHPDIPPSFVSSMLKQFVDNFSVTRVHAPEKVDGRSIYAYTTVSEADRKKLLSVAKRKRKQAQERAAHARAVKQNKSAPQETPTMFQDGSFVRYEKKSLSDLLGDYEAVNAKIAEAKPTTTEWSVDEVLDNLTVKQARALHIALKEMFGGV